MGTSGVVEITIGTVAPTGLEVGSLWADTSASPPLLMILQSLAPDTWVASAGGGSVQGAPADAQYLVLAANTRLTAEVVHGAVDVVAGHHASFLQADHDALPHPYPMFLDDGGGEGEPGPPGASGPAGPQGLQGIPGLDGEAGEEGPMGPLGVAGAAGATGAQGPTGPAIFLEADVLEGEPGPPGARGADGAAGAPGTTGAQGPTGPPVYLVADIEEGPMGPPGPPGTNGTNGTNGTTGAQGPIGPALAIMAQDGEDAIMIPGPPGAKGADGAPGGGGSWTTKVKTADQTNNTATLVDDTVLQFATVANTQYTIRILAFFLTNATADCKYRMEHTGTTTRVRRRVRRTATTDIAQTIVLATAFDAADVVLSTTGLNPWLEEDIILQVGASGGVLKLQWAQVTLNAGPTSCLEGSYLEYAAA